MLCLNVRHLLGFASMLLLLLSFQFSHAQVVIIISDVGQEAQGPDGAVASPADTPAFELTSGFDLAPNPATKQVVLTVTQAAALREIEITDEQGRVVFHTSQCSGELYAAEVGPGRYDFTVVSDRWAETQPLWVVPAK